MKFLSILLLICAVNAKTIPLKGTPFSNLKHYSISGILSLPYAEINEPFRAWYDVEQSASRIDYYDGWLKMINFYIFNYSLIVNINKTGMVSTIQLAPTSSSDAGVAIKIAPLTDETVTNAKTCFWVNGTTLAPSNN